MSDTEGTEWHTGIACPSRSPRFIIIIYLVGFMLLNFAASCVMFLYHVPNIHSVSVLSIFDYHFGFL